MGEATLDYLGLPNSLNLSPEAFFAQVWESAFNLFSKSPFSSSRTPSFTFLIEQIKDYFSILKKTEYIITATEPPLPTVNPTRTQKLHFLAVLFNNLACYYLR